MVAFREDKMSVIAFATDGFSATLSALMDLMLMSCYYKYLHICTVCWSTKDVRKKKLAPNDKKPLPEATQTMEENNIDNNNQELNINPLPQIQAAVARPGRSAPCVLCLFVTLGCLLLGGIPLLIAGAYYYSAYDQHGGINYTRKFGGLCCLIDQKLFTYLFSLETTCILENTWYEIIDSDSYDVKASVSIKIIFWLFIN